MRIVPDAQDLPALSAMLTRSFDENKASNSWLRPENRTAAMHRYFELLLQWHLNQPGTLSVSRALDVCTIWDRPGSAPRWPVTIRALRLLSSLGWDMRSYRPIRLRNLMSKLETHRPWGIPHWYLVCVGVDPTVQGTGRGTAFLRAEFAARDRAGEAIYLEAIDARAETFYKRFGFDVMTNFELSGDIHVRGMWRNPSYAQQ